MSRFNHNPTRRYREIVSRLQDYAEGADPQEDPVRAAADALEDDLREDFKKRHHVDETTGGADCIGRLIAGWSSCQHGGVRPRGERSDLPPHRPPHPDHCDLWLRDGEPAAYTMHLYDVGHDVLEEVLAFADEHGLEAEIDPTSWYYLGRTVHIVFTKSE